MNIYDEVYIVGVGPGILLESNPGSSNVKIQRSIPIIIDGKTIGYREEFCYIEKEWVRKQHA